MPRAVGEHFVGDLRRALLDTAAAALDERGADAVSLRDVARRCGVSHAAPAHHFGDKTGLLTAVATDGFTLFIEHLARALAKGTQDPVAQLGTLARAYADFADRHPGHVEVMFRPGLTRVDDPDYDAASHAAFGLLHAHIIRCQAAGWNQDEDSRALAAAAWSLAHGITVLRAQGSLGKHYPDDSLDGVVAIASTLVTR